MKQFFDATGTATMDRTAASKAMSAMVKGNQKAGDTTAADAASAERAATVGLSKQMQGASSPSAAAQIKADADTDRLRYAPTPAPSATSPKASTSPSQAQKNVASATRTAQQHVDSTHNQGDR